MDDSDSSVNLKLDFDEMSCDEAEDFSEPDSATTTSTGNSGLFSFTCNIY